MGAGRGTARRFFDMLIFIVLLATTNMSSLTQIKLKISVTGKSLADNELSGSLPLDTPVDSCNSWVDFVFKLPNEVHDTTNGLIDVIKESDNTTDPLLCDFYWDIGTSAVRSRTLRTDREMKLERLVGFPADDITWQCQLDGPYQLCDGYSACLNDECNCEGVDVFYCIDKSGCVAFSGLCDGFYNCKDGSDECFCPGVYRAELAGSDKTLCVQKRQYCVKEDYFIVGNPAFSHSGEFAKECRSYAYDHAVNPITKCLEDAREFLERKDGFFAVANYCEENCSTSHGMEKEWQRFCKYTNFNYPAHLVFNCEPVNIIPGKNQFGLEVICDGVNHCSNNADEIDCPGYFYCSPNVSTVKVPLHKMCDHVKDCPNGADECGTCSFEAISSSETLIKSPVILVMTLVSGVVIILMNLREGYKCWHSNPSTKVGRIDRFFILQIFLYDVLMGVYLTLVFMAAVVLKFRGSYCLLERKWRSSMSCSALGALFSFSSHGSLFTIALVSITRFITCRYMGIDIKMRIMYYLAILSCTINMMHSVIPLLPISSIQNIFRTEIYFVNLNKNPFFNDNPINESRLSEVYEGMFGEKSDDTWGILHRLQSTTSQSEIYEYNEVSYYGNTGLCIHNIFKSNSSYVTYKIIYCSSLLIILAIVSVTYIMIILHQRNISKEAAGNAQKTSKILALKVSLMIGSELACWLPLILTSLYFQYQSTGGASPMVFEVFGLVIVPLNSLLNPLFYSRLYKKVALCAWRIWRERVRNIF